LINLQSKYGIYDPTVPEPYQTVKTKNNPTDLIDNDTLLAFIYSSNTPLQKTHPTFTKYKEAIDKARCNAILWGLGGRGNWYDDLGIPKSRLPCKP